MSDHASPPKERLAWWLDVVRWLQTIGKILKFGLFPLAGRLPIPAWRRDPFAVRFRHALEELGLTYLKLGQFLALRFDILPAEVCLELNHLFENVDAMPPGLAERAVAREFGAPVGTVFASFSAEPIAAASVGQVHIGYLHNGRKVAIKVQRVGIEVIFRADIRNLRRLTAMAQRLGAFGRMSGVEMLEQFERWTLRELDFRSEGHTADRVRANAGQHAVVPQIHWDLTTARVLTMEFIEGISGSRLTDFISSASPEEKRRRLADFSLHDALYNFVEAALTQVFVDGFFHGDPHPGNIQFLSRNRVAFLDFGIFGSLSTTERAVVTGQIECLAVGDIGGSLRHYSRQVIVTEDTNIDRFNAQCLEVLYRWYHSMSDPRSSVGERHLARYSGEMIGISRANGLAYDMNYLLFWRAMTNLNATLWHLDPDYDLIAHLKDFFQRTQPGLLARLRAAVCAPAWAQTFGGLCRDAAGNVRDVLKEPPRVIATPAWSPRRERRLARSATGGGMLLVLLALIVLTGVPGLDPTLRWGLPGGSILGVALLLRGRR